MRKFFIASPKQMQKTIAVMAVVALVQAPFIGAAQARIKVGVTAAVIPQAAMGETQEVMKTITVGENVDEDVLIETGRRGRTQVLFVDGSSMNIGPSSRIIVDDFVFDPAQLSGNLGARIEKGSMRFIGGVLSKRAGQVKFTAGEATVGIRGGIAKIAVETDGKLLAELVHGRLSVETPEGLFETDRIGMQIERDVNGAVSTRSVTIEEVKSELDEEAKENEAAAEENIAEAPAASAAAEDNDAAVQTETPSDTPAEANENDGAADRAAAEGAPAQQDDTLSAAGEAKEETGDVLVDAPIDAGLVEVDADGNLKASQALVEIDPQAAELIDEGALVVSDEGAIVPTEKILAIDDTAREMFEAGYLKIDDDGILVPATDIEQAGFFNSAAPLEVEQKVVSNVTLEEFNYAEPELLSSENQFKSNLARSQRTLERDENVAKLFELGQLEVGADGALKPTERFDPLIVARSSRLTGNIAARDSIIQDKAADRLLLSAGALDTKMTTRVVGSDLASNIFSAEVTRVISADIVRDDAINSIERLASANRVALPDDLKERKLDELVSIGGALSTRDALKASFDTPEADILLPEIIIGDRGSEKVIDYKVSEEVQQALNLPESDGVLTDETISGWISAGIDGTAVIELITRDDSLVQTDLIAGGDSPKDDGLSSIVPITAPDDIKDDGLSGIVSITAPDKSQSDDRIFLVPSLPVEEIKNSDDFEDFGREAFVGSLGDEFIKEDSDILKSTGVESISEATRTAESIGDGLLVPIREEKEEIKEDDASANYSSSEKEAAKDEPTYIEPVYVEPVKEEELARGQIEDELENKQEAFDFWKLNIAGQRAPTGDTVFGAPGSSSFAPSWTLWEAYNSGRGAERSYIVRESDNSVFISFDTNIVDSSVEVSGDENRRTSANQFKVNALAPSGNVKDLLALNNFSFQAAVRALAGYTRSTFIDNEPEQQTLKFSADNINAMSAEAKRVNRAVNMCDCAYISTGIWKNEVFTNESLSNITYQHQGHWAIGQPLSSDTLKRLAGMKASFTGHAVGTVISPSLNETGYGNVTVNVDFADPTGSGNNFKLTDFRSENYQLEDIPTVFLDLDTSNGEFAGRNSYSDMVDGALYGDSKDLQAGGSFSVSRSTTSASEVSISGSFAAEATSISK